MGWEHTNYFKDCEKILDAGCGFWEMMEAFPDKVVGIDLDRKVIGDCKAKGYNVKRGSVTKIPFEENHFDGVISSHVIEHLIPHDALKMMFEVGRVLKPGGLFMLRTPVFDDNFYKQNFDHIKPYPPQCIKRLLKDYPEMNLEWQELIYDFKFPFHKFVHRLFNLVFGRKKESLKKNTAKGRVSSVTILIRITQKLAKIPFMRSGYTMLLRKRRGT